MISTTRRPAYCFLKSAAIVGFAVVVASALPPLARAACNIIPAARTTFRGTLGSVSQPFAQPGDLIDVTLDPACHGTAPRFAGDDDVTLLFTPPAGPRNAVVLRPSCSGFAASAEKQSCEAKLAGGVASCLEVNGVGKPALAHLSGATVRFEFPDTDPLLLGANDDLTLSGPLTIAVTANGSPLPCELASQSCSSSSAPVLGIRACVDRLFADDGSCDPNAGEVFPSFTALPPPNNYLDLCTIPDPPCTGSHPDIRMAIDAAGNLLIPMDWSGVLLPDDIQVARQLRGGLMVDAFPGTGSPVLIPDPKALSSYSAEGIRIDPIFDLQVDPTMDHATFFGTADYRRTVLRVARHATVVQQCTSGGSPDQPGGGSTSGLPCIVNDDCRGGGSCGNSTCFVAGTQTTVSCQADRECSAYCASSTCSIGGATTGVPCSRDEDCLAAECGPGLFDFSTRLAEGVGPVVDPASALGVRTQGVQALDPVPLDGLNQTAELNSFVEEEAIADKDLNGDGVNDKTDHVVKLSARLTGLIETIGENGSEGRAVARVQDPPFSFPALAVEDNVLAFLEPETAQGSVDRNGNGRIFDLILRAFRVGDGAAIDLLPGANLGVDGAPLVNDRSLAISAGRLFVRIPEWENAPLEATPSIADPPGVEPDGAGDEPSLSADGRFVAFSSDATNLVADDTNSMTDVFVRDHLSGETTRVSVQSSGNQVHRRSFNPSISADGRYVAFASDATTLVSKDTNHKTDIFVHDRQTHETTRVSVATDGTQGNGDSSRPSISADGRFVTFVSYATNLVPDDTNEHADAFLRDRANNTTTRISVHADGSQMFTDAADPTISGDGSLVIFSGGFEGPSIYDRLANATGQLGSLSTFTRSLAFQFALPPGSFVAQGGGSVSFEDNSARTNGGIASVTLTPRDGQLDVYSFEAVVFAAGLARATTTPTDRPEMTVKFSFDEETFLSTNEWIRTRQGWTLGCLGGSECIAAQKQPTIDLGDETLDFFGLIKFTQSFDPSHSAFSISLEAVGAGTTTIATGGRFVAFTSAVPDLVPGDTNGKTDVFLYDRLKGSTTLASVASTGEQGDDASDSPSVSSDGRFVAFESDATNLASRRSTLGRHAYLHDRLTGETSLIVPPEWESFGSFDKPTISGDGRTIALVYTPDAEVVGGHAIAKPGIVTTLTPSGSASSDKSGDGEIDDVVLAALPTAGTGAEATSAIEYLCPATKVSVDAGRAAFLRPEAAGPTDPGQDHLPLCPAGKVVAGGVDLNMDGDAQDEVVHFWSGSGMVQNLDEAATDVLLSGSWIAALVPQDGHQIPALHPTDGGGWTEIPSAADAIALSGSVLAFTTPEDGAGVPGAPTGSVRRVLQVVDTGSEPLEATDTGETAEDFVVGSTGLVAFRTLESVQGEHLLDGDGPATKGVLQIYDPARKAVVNTGQAVIPCFLEACDPRVPYRISGNTALFLTLESDQGRDLNGDGDTKDLVLQHFNIRRAGEGLAQLKARARGGLGLVGSAMAVVADATHVLASATAGVCTTTGQACATDAGCSGGSCFVPPGGCIRDLQTPCDPTTVDDPSPGGDGLQKCLADEFCAPTPGHSGSGSCQVLEGPCSSRSDCSPDATVFCSEGEQQFARIANPFAQPHGGNDGSAVFVGAGRCIQNLMTSCSGSAKCPAGQFCDGGMCHREQGACSRDQDCPFQIGANEHACVQSAFAATAADSDGDEVPDAIDNCPHVPNIMQSDVDGDNVGDQCDVEERALNVSLLRVRHSSVPGAADGSIVVRGTIDPVVRDGTGRISIRKPIQAAIVDAGRLKQRVKWRREECTSDDQGVVRCSTRNGLQSLVMRPIGGVASGTPNYRFTMSLGGLKVTVGSLGPVNVKLTQEHWIDHARRLTGCKRRSFGLLCR